MGQLCLFMTLCSGVDKIIQYAPANIIFLICTIGINTVSYHILKLFNILRRA